MSKKLSIGIIINNENIPIWIFRTIEEIVNSGCSVVKVLVIQPEILKSDLNKRYSFIFNLHRILDRLIFRKRFDYDKIVSTNELLKGVHKIQIKTELNGQVRNQAINGNSEKIKDLNLDIVLNFCNSLNNPSRYKSVKYGIWSYNVGQDCQSSYLNGYWELIKKTGANLTVAVSDSFSEKDKVIFQAIEDNYSVSLNQNLNQLLGLSSLIIPRLIKRVYSEGEIFIDKLIKNCQNESTARISEISKLKTPSSYEALKNIAIILKRTIEHKLIYKRFESWYLLYRISPEQDPTQINIQKFKRLLPSKDRFWADPFVIAKGNRFYIFLEEFLFKEGKAHISVLEIDHSGILVQSHIVMERPYHISYPFVFEWKEIYYMIPETTNNKTIELYKCTCFPNKWEFEMNIMEGISAIDTTLLFYENKWWLFTILRESVLSPGFSELFLFYSDDFLTNKWISHPNNPISSDITSARPAGKIFSYKNNLYRPSQDCLERYGRALNINLITNLTENSYKEVLVNKFESGLVKGIKGIHTFNFDKTMTVLDAYEYRKRI